MILISLMPVIFGPPECLVVTDRSPVAAGGIANVSPICHAEFRRKADDRLCGSLVLLIQDSFLIPFEIKTPDLSVLRLHGVPWHSAVWTFLPAIGEARIRVPKVRCLVYRIFVIYSTETGSKSAYG